MSALAGRGPHHLRRLVANNNASALAYIQSRAKQLGLDPKAVLAIGSHEGLGGGIGDNGTSFGPFQLHAGGALPGSVWSKGPQFSQQWAWSPAGINYAEQAMARSGAAGKTGLAAISAISRNFERPANPAAEIADAARHYGLSVSPGQIQSASGGAPSAGTGNASALAGALLSGAVPQQTDPSQNFIGWVMQQNNALMQRANPVGYTPF